MSFMMGPFYFQAMEDMYVLGVLGLLRALQQRGRTSRDVPGLEYRCMQASPHRGSYTCTPFAAIPRV